MATATEETRGTAELLENFAVKAIKARAVSVRFTAVAVENTEGEEAAEPKWLKPTIAAMSRLPWDETNIPDGGTAPQPKAAAELLWLLVGTLDNSTIAPTSIGPTWKGGVTAEWHANGFDLEIECDPEGNKTYYFNGPEIEEYEGPIEDDLTRLQRHFRMLPDHRE